MERKGSMQLEELLEDGGEYSSNSANFANVFMLPFFESVENETPVRILVVGSAHCSQESVDEIRELVRHERPRVVFVELDDSRVRLLEGVGNSGTPKTNVSGDKDQQQLAANNEEKQVSIHSSTEKGENSLSNEGNDTKPPGTADQEGNKELNLCSDWELMKMMAALIMGRKKDPTCKTQSNAATNPENTEREGNTRANQDSKYLQLLNLLSIFIRRLLERSNIDLSLYGADMRAAADEALDIGAIVVLGDQPIRVTLRRLWKSMDWWERTKLVTGIGYLMLSGAKISPEDVEELKRGDVLSHVLNQMASSYPSLFRTFISERNVYLATALWNTAVSVAIAEESEAEHYSDVPAYSSSRPSLSVRAVPAQHIKHLITRIRAEDSSQSLRIDWKKPGSFVHSSKCDQSLENCKCGLNSAKSGSKGHQQSQSVILPPPPFSVDEEYSGPVPQSELFYYSSAVPYVVCSCRTVVAVVGAGHVSGMQEVWSDLFSKGFKHHSLERLPRRFAEEARLNPPSWNNLFTFRRIVIFSCFLVFLGFLLNKIW